MRAVCPKCDRAYNLPDDKRGKKLRCKNCEEVFVARDVEDEDEEDRAPAKPRRSADARVAASRSRRAADDDDDDDEGEGRRPRRRKKQEPANGPPLGLILGLGGGGVAVVAIVVVLILVLGKSAPPADSSAGNPTGPGPGGQTPKPGQKVAVQVPLQHPESNSQVISFSADGQVSGFLYLNTSAGQVGNYFDTYDLKTRNRVAHAPVDSRMAMTVGLNTDGSMVAMQLAEIGKPNPITVWSLPDGNPVVSDWAPYPKPADLSQAFGQEMVWFDFVARDRVVTVTRNGTFDIWSLPGKQRVSHGAGNLQVNAFLDVNGFVKQPKNLALSRDRTMLALFNGDGFDLVNTANGQVVRKTAALGDAGNVGNSWGLDFSPDGKWLAFYYTPAGSLNEARLVYWDVTGGQRTNVQKFRLNFGDTVVSWWDNQYLLLWDATLTSCICIDARSGSWLCKCKCGSLGRFAAVGPGSRLWYANARATLGPGVLSGVDPPPDLAAAQPQPPGTRNLPVWTFTPDGIQK